MDPPWVTHPARDHSQWTEDCCLGWGPLPTTREVDSTSRHRGWEASRMEATDDAHSKLLINIFTSTGEAPDGKLGLEIPAPCRSHDSPTTEVRQEPGDSPFLPLGRVCINEIVKVFWKPRNCMRFSALSHSVVSDSLWPPGLQHARPPCPLPTPGAYSNSCPLSR